jgi:hypothetical protein
MDRDAALRDAKAILSDLGVPPAFDGLVIAGFGQRLQAMGEMRLRALLDRLVDDLVAYAKQDTPTQTGGA